MSAEALDWMYDGQDTVHSYTSTVPGDVFYDYVKTTDLYEFTTETVNSLTSVDIDGDNHSDVILCHSNTEVVGISGKDGSILFRYSAEKAIKAGPLVLDLDDDGVLEIVLGLSSGRLVWYEIDDGLKSPTSIVLGNKLGTYSQVMALPLEDGTYDLVVVDKTGTVQSIANDGTLNWEVEFEKVWPRSISIEKRWDGYKVLTATIEATGSLSHMESDIVRINGVTGRIEKEMVLNRTIFSDFFTTRPSILDFHGDINIIIGGHKGYIIDADTFEIEQVPTKIGGLIACIPVINDGRPSIIYRGMDTLIAYDIIEKKVQWEVRSSINPYNLLGFPIILCDLDEDGAIEVIVPFLHNIQILNMTSGEEITRITFNSMYTRGKLITPILCDIDADGYIELVYSCRLDNWRIQVYSTPNVEFFLNTSISTPGTIVYPEAPKKLGYRITNIPSIQRISGGRLLVGDAGNLPWIDILGDTCDVVQGDSEHSILIRSIEVEAHAIEYLFELTIDWRIETEALQNSTLTINLGNRPPRHLVIPNVIRFENDLVFKEPLVVKNTEGDLISESKWLHPNTTITLEGGPVVFEGSEVSPTKGTFRIQQRTPLHTDYIETADNGSFKKAVDLIDYRDEYWSTTIRIIDVPYNGSVFDSYEFNCRIDWFRPEIHLTTPEPDVWKTQYSIRVGFDLFDNESGLDIDSIKISLLLNDSTIHEFIKFNVTVLSPGHIRLMSTIILQNGQNWIGLITRDIVGNMNETGLLPINVDTTQIVFQDFSPTGWNDQTDVLVGITVIDHQSSGVNLSSVEYSYSNSGIFEYSEWISLGFYGEAPTHTFTISLELIEGVKNHVRFRARDVAGNEHRISDDYLIRIDTTPPQIEMVEEDRNHLNSSISFIITDNLSGIQSNSITIAITSNGTQLSDTAFDLVSIGFGSQRLTIDCEFIIYTQNHIRIELMDVATNSNQSMFNVIINAPPILNISLPTNNSEYSIGESVLFEMNAFDPDGDELSIVWMMSNGTVIETVSVFELSFEEGTYVIVCQVTDGNEHMVAENVTIRVEPEAPPESTIFTIDDPNLLILILILIIVTTLIIRFLRKRSHQYTE